ncbi:aggregation-promoting factor C-terminal-like domain-containing protein [Streptomyces sp. NPDC001985]|uniref:aggregation-promoting factor C-terminal-like domain-containing protein n=1 Tax=Streptomyces sp. NPDC001985 TaxID=3154406 RepID=UPI00331B3705
MSRISVRGFAVASATAVTTVGAVVGVASGSAQPANDNLETAAADATLLADIPMGQQAQVQVASIAEQASAQAAVADAAAKKAAEEDARHQAAKTAKAKKEAADAKAEQERLAEEKAAKEKAEREKKEKEERASRAAARDTVGTASASAPAKGSYTVAEVQAIARGIIPAGQFQCFSNIVQRESTWNYKAENPSSGAYGLVQALPATKMATAGADWRTNPATQIKWGLNYMNERYDSPCGAWSFWQANRWY